MEYTKGDWYVEEDDIEEMSILSIPEGEDFPDVIATVREIGKCDGEEMLANAQLIASAPALYEALRDLLEAWDTILVGEGDYHRIFPVKVKARKALAKAGGK